MTSTELLKQTEQLDGFICIKHTVTQHVFQSPIKEINDRIVKMGEISFNPLLEKDSLRLIDRAIGAQSCTYSDQSIHGSSVYACRVKKATVLKFLMQVDHQFFLLAYLSQQPY
ncbi:Unknown protein sequence [Pseudomonas syringae pv. maculicola]|nr:Unknown protein sequence [Pseudomonas syringae pv. maculicola]